MRTGNILEDINVIIANCDDIQTSNESAHTKDVAKILAYEEIREIILALWGMAE